MFRWQLAEYLETHGITTARGQVLQDLLVNRAGVHLSHNSVMALIKKPPKAIRLETLDALCTVLDCNPWDLLTYAASSGEQNDQIDVEEKEPSSRAQQKAERTLQRALHNLEAAQQKAALKLAKLQSKVQKRSAEIQNITEELATIQTLLHTNSSTDPASTAEYAVKQDGLDTLPLSRGEGDSTPPASPDSKAGESMPKGRTESNQPEAPKDKESTTPLVQAREAGQWSAAHSDQQEETDVAVAEETELTEQSEQPDSPGKKSRKKHSHVS